MDLNRKFELADAYVADVRSKLFLIDSNTEREQYSLALGYFIGKGLDPFEAHDMASWIIENPKVA